MERRPRTPIVRFAVRRGSVWFDLAPPSTIVLVIFVGPGQACLGRPNKINSTSVPVGLLALGRAGGLYFDISFHHSCMCVLGFFSCLFPLPLAAAGAFWSSEVFPVCVCVYFSRGLKAFAQHSTGMLSAVMLCWALLGFVGIADRCLVHR